MRLTPLWIAAAPCAVAALVLALLRVRAEAIARSDARAATPRGTAATSEVIAPTRSEPRPNGLPSAPEVLAPASLDGTDVDGDVHVHANGRLAVDRDLRRLFDYFLAASGEEAPSITRARILAALRRHGSAVDEAAALLDRYLAYREAARALVASAPQSMQGSPSLETVHALRARFFDEATCEAFFGDEEREMGAALARGATTMPARLLSARANALRGVESMALDAELRARGASRAELRAARAHAFGDQGALRLAALDDAHDAWRARVLRYRAERDALAAAAPQGVLQSDALEALRARYFDANEKVRIDALDRASAR